MNKMGLHEGMVFQTKQGTTYLIGDVEGNSVKIFPSNGSGNFRFSNKGRYVYKDFIDRNAVKFLSDEEIRRLK